MTEAPVVLAMLFADICGSVSLYESRGDDVASRLVLATRAALVSTMHRNGGRLAGTAGDGVLGAFPSADRACRAAIEMQQSLRQSQVAIKVGIHTGPVIETAGDVFGDTVNTASRVMSLARPGEILLTEETVALCREGAPADARFLDTRMVEGRIKPVSLYSLFVDDGGQSTVIAPSPVATVPQGLVGVLVLVGVDGRQVLVERDGQSVVVGRDLGCDIVVPHQLVSRRHATIEAKRGKFVITDRSTNGTWVVARPDAVTFLRREAMTLLGTGWIVPGEAPAGEVVEGVRFTVFSADQMTEDAA